MRTESDLSNYVSLSIDDERAIGALLIRYATSIDRRDWLLLRTCFADDFAGDYGPSKRWSSADEIVEYMIARHEPVGPSLHRISNIVAHASAEGATARSYVDALLMPKVEGGRVVQATGFYDDQIVQIMGEWRIKERRFTLVRLLHREATG